MSGIDTLIEKYTKIESGYDVDGEPCWWPYFEVEQQSFCIAPEGCESLEHAKWFCRQFALALEKVVENENPG